MNPIPLSTLPNRQRARIHAITADDALSRKLLEMGVTEGLEVRVLHRGLLGGDPLAIALNDRIIALRRRDATHIAVELL